MKTPLKLIAVLFLGVYSTASAQVLYSQNFDSFAPGTTPAGWSSHADFKVTDTDSVSPSNSYRAADSSGSNWAASSLLFNNAPGIAATSIVNFSFDLRVANYQGLVNGAAGTFRVALLPASSGGAPSQFIFGLGYNTMGDLGSTLFFYAGSTSAPTPSSSNAIGWDGTNFLPGFNLGALGAGDNNGTGGNFYRVSMTYDKDSKDMAITVINLANLSQSATFNTVWTPGVEFSESNGALIATTGGASTGNLFLDNVIITAIPEPGSLALLGLAALSLLARRTPRRRRV